MASNKDSISIRHEEKMINNPIKVLTYIINEKEKNISQDVIPTYFYQSVLEQR